MIRAHKIRLNPTPEQETYLKKGAGIARFVFNWGLARWKELKEQGVDHYGPMALKKEFNAIKREQFPWTLEVTKNAVESGFRNLGAAFANYYSSKQGRRRGEKVGFPRFKSKRHSKHSFTLDYARFRVEGHWLHIQKLGSPINMAETLRFSGRVKWATVSCQAGKWYVSITVEITPTGPGPQAGIGHAFPSVGVDLGIRTLATLSDGTEFENQKLLQTNLNKLKRLNRTLSRRQPNSQRWWKAKRALARFHERVANQRSDTIHKLTTHLARTYRIVGVEDLNIKGMSRNRRLALSIADAGFGEILRQLDYKMDTSGGELVKVGRFFASSKTCSTCGDLNRELTISDRKWICANCGTSHDRDFNASANIEIEALRLAGGRTLGSGYVERNSSWTECKTAA